MCLDTQIWHQTKHGKQFHFLKLVSLLFLVYLNNTVMTSRNHVTLLELNCYTVYRIWPLTFSHYKRQCPLFILDQIITSRVYKISPNWKKNTKNYLKYIFFVLSILQIYLYIYVLNKNSLQFYFWYTKLVYLKSAKLELILYLMHFNCKEVKSSHLYLYSAFNNTNCDKATAQYQNGEIVSIM